MTNTMSKGEISRMAQAPLPSVTLWGALARAQSKMPTAILNKVNPHFRNKYADLASLRAATIPALSEQGLCIVQYTGFDNNNNFGLFTRLAHDSGEFIEGFYPLPVDLSKPQAMGSALTYARRYGWGSIVGEASEEDDDANAAEGAIKNGQLKHGEAISAAQLQELSDLADEVAADKEKFCKYMKVSSIAAIPSAKFAEAKAALEGKRNADA